METQIKTIENIIYSLMREFNVPGLAISIIRDGEIFYEKGYGARNLEENLPMTKDTLIGIGSISKSFTAILILKLQEQSLISIEDPVQKYLDMEPFISHPNILIKHLLSHSSGIPSVDGQWFPIAMSFGNYDRIYPVASREDYLYHISETKDEIFFKPGEKFFYNNDMFTLLGFIIEKITGESFETILTKNIFEPLEMTRSSISREHLERDPIHDYIRGYLHKGIDGENGNKGKIKLEHPKLPFTRDLQAPGGIFASMHELSNYARFLLQRGQYNNNQIISSDSINNAWIPRIDGPYGYGKDPKYGFGWSLEKDVFDHTLIHHGGSIGISSSFIGIVPDLNLAVCVAENDDAGISGIIGMCALSLMMEKNPEDIVGKYLLLKVYEQIKGKYKSSLGLYEMEVYLSDQSIYIKVETDDGTFILPLIAENLKKLEFKISMTVEFPVKRVKFYKDEEKKQVKFVTYDRYLYHKQ